MTLTTNPIAAEELSFESAGLRIFARCWLPEAAPKAILAICHGVNSHSGQYLWVGEQMAAQGFAVYALDLHGRGLSEGERFLTATVDDYAADLDRLIDLAVEREGALPIYLLGHSAGGVVSCIYALEKQARLAGLVCESFAFKVPAPNFALSLIKGLSHIAPRLPVLTLKNKDFSRDAATVAAMNADPLIAGETQPAQTVAALARADDRLRREFPAITLPLLILHGTADKATLPSGSEFFFETAGSADKTLKLYEGHFHDLLNDHGKESVLDEILGWIEARISADVTQMAAAR